MFGDVDLSAKYSFTLGFLRRAQPHDCIPKIR
jgi:hypothetical protein